MNLKTDQILNFPVAVDNYVSAVDRLRHALVSVEPRSISYQLPSTNSAQLVVIELFSLSVGSQLTACRPHWFSYR